MIIDFLLEVSARKKKCQTTPSTYFIKLCIVSTDLSLCRGLSLFAKVHGKEKGSHSAKPPVSKVRPLMEDGRSVNTEDEAPVSLGRIERPK